MPRRGRRTAGLATAVAALIGLVVIAFGMVVLYAESKLSTLVLGGLGESFSTKVYAAPFVLEDGAATSPERLIERLGRLGYRLTAQPNSPGDFSWTPPLLDVWLRGFKAPMFAQEPEDYRLEWKSGLFSGPAHWELKTSSGAPAAQIALEPEVAAELSGAKRIRREPATEAELPERLKIAVISAEDKRFYRHWGLDLRAMARALWANMRGRSTLQGASTITQQLSKNMFLSPRRTIKRKLAEAALAVYLELRYGKERILALYLNHIYMGQDGPVSVMGMKAAAHFYFGKDLKDLSLSECATLAGIIRSPHRYNPFRDLRAANERRSFVLNRMREDGSVTPEELRAALREPLKLRLTRPGKAERRDSDYFTAEVVRQLLPRYGEDALFRQGLSLYTTMDPLLQRAAQRAARKGKPQAALVALDPANGKVLALVGGRDFGESQFNRATQALRQPGSSFKPFVYGAALEKGSTPATLLADTTRSYPVEIAKSTKPWSPANYGGIYFGTATLRTALAHSLNAATLDLAEKTGTRAVIDFARKAGIKSPLEDSLATMLGSSEVTLLELSSAYAAFANGGFRVEPRLILAVADAEGNVLEFSPLERAPALDPALAYLVTSLLETVIAEGTGKPLKLWGWDRPAAAKTGTTNDGRDAWFIGYTPRLLAGVWVGDDRHRKVNATGAKDALPLWAAFMKESAGDFAAEDFKKPEGLVSVRIDPVSGLRALSGCPVKEDELFLAGTEPTRDCPLHRGGIIGFFKRLFGKS